MKPSTSNQKKLIKNKEAQGWSTSYALKDIF